MAPKFHTPFDTNVELRPDLRCTAHKTIAIQGRQTELTLKNVFRGPKEPLKTIPVRRNGRGSAGRRGKGTTEAFQINP